MSLANKTYIDPKRFSNKYILKLPKSSLLHLEKTLELSPCSKTT